MFCCSLKTTYVEIQLGQNAVSRSGIKSLLEQIIRIDSIIEQSEICLLHTETEILFNKLIRSIDIP